MAFPNSGKFKSTPIQSVQYGTLFQYNSNYPTKYIAGDTWYTTWADDNNIYVTANDVFGWNCTSGSPCPSSNLQFSSLSTFDNTTTGTLINGMSSWGTQGQTGSDGATYKSAGLLSVNGTLYWWLIRKFNGGDFPSLAAQLVKSTDHGVTWTPTPPSTAQPYTTPMFTNGNFSAPNFVNYPIKDYVGGTVDNSGTYIYMTSGQRISQSVAGTQISLGRVKISDISALDATKYSFYKGGDGMLDSSWDSNPANAIPIQGSANVNKIDVFDMMYIPSFNRYLIHISGESGLGSTPPVSQYIGQAGETTLQFFDAPKPWGPWRFIQADKFGGNGFYFPAFVTKSYSGNNVTVLISGDFRTFNASTIDAAHSVYTLWESNLTLNGTRPTTPLTIFGTSLAAWYDASAPKSVLNTLGGINQGPSPIYATDGQQVAGWVDQSYTGYDLFNTTNGPTYKATGFNGKPGIQYTNSGSPVTNLYSTDTRGGWGNPAVPFFEGNKAYSIFAVGNFTSSCGAFARMVEVTDATGSTLDFLQTDCPGGILAGNTPVGAVGVLFGANSLSTISAGTNFRYGQVVDGSFSTTYLNNVATTPVAFTPNAYNSNGHTISTGVTMQGNVPQGGSAGWDGMIAEIVILNRAATASERLALDNYFKAKWGLS